MSPAIDVEIGVQHGDGCICRPLEPIAVQPVIVDRGCRAARGHRLDEQTARVARQISDDLGIEAPADYPGGGIVIAWPKAASNGTPLVTWAVELYERETGKQILTATGMRIAIGGDSWQSEPIYADLTLLVDENGNPAEGFPANAAIDEHGEFRTRVFRCWVAEMRTRTDSES